MKSIFFKTVRSNGRSIFAIGRFARIYQIGKTYSFAETQPSHVFILDKNGAYNVPGEYAPAIDKVPTPQVFDSDVIYRHRPEKSHGNRVLVCYGELKLRKVPVCDVDSNWNFKDIWGYTMKMRWTSTKFTVIGEIKPKTVDSECGFNFDKLAVIGKFIKSHATHA